MKKKRKPVMVLGKGQVLFMSLLFVLLCVCLFAAYLLLRSRDSGTAIAALFFSVASFLATVFLLEAYFHHKKEDEQREAAWDELEKKRQSIPERKERGE